MKIAVYVAGTGLITRVITGPSSLAGMQAGSGESELLLGDDKDVSDTLHYVSLSGTKPEIAPRVALDTKHTVDGLSVVFHALPSGLTLRTEGVETETDAEPTEIEFDAPGTYEIRIYPPPQYRDEVLEVTVG